MIPRKQTWQLAIYNFILLNDLMKNLVSDNNMKFKELFRTEKLRMDQIIRFDDSRLVALLYLVNLIMNLTNWHVNQK